MTEVKSDIQIAREAKMEPIKDILAKINVPDESSAFSPMGRHIAKINLEYLNTLKKKDGNLILVTAITPTPAGEGKTTTSVGLNDGLNKIGKTSIVCLREPSLGPSFGMKGGAAGGGYAQVVPMEQINFSNMPTHWTKSRTLIWHIDFSQYILDRHHFGFSCYLNIRFYFSH